MKKLIPILLIFMAAIFSTSANAASVAEAFSKAGSFGIFSTTSAYTSDTVANGMIVYAGSYKTITITASGGGNNGLNNYSGSLYIWGSNDYTGTGTPTTGQHWAVVKKLAGDTTSITYEGNAPYKYLAVGYTPSRVVVPSSAKFRVDADYYLYQPPM